MARCAAESGGMVTSHNFAPGSAMRDAVGVAFRMAAELRDDASFGFANFRGRGGVAFGGGQAQAKRLADGELAAQDEFGAAAADELRARGLGEFLAGLVGAVGFETKRQADAIAAACVGCGHETSIGKALRDGPRCAAPTGLASVRHAYPGAGETSAAKAASMARDYGTTPDQVGTSSVVP